MVSSSSCWGTAIHPEVRGRLISLVLLCPRGLDLQCGVQGSTEENEQGVEHTVVPHLLAYRSEAHRLSDEPKCADVIGVEAQTEE